MTSPVAPAAKLCREKTAWTTSPSSTASRKPSAATSIAASALLSGDVAFLTGILVAIDITLAGLFWALAGDDHVLAQLIRKVLYVGFFALLINNFKGLADIVFPPLPGLV